MDFAVNLDENMISESDMFIKLVTEPHLCILMNPELSQERVENMKKTFHIVPIEFNGLLYNAVVIGFFKPGAFPEPEYTPDGRRILAKASFG